MVATRIAEPGLSVAANSALMSVHDLSLMELEVLVPTSQIPAIRVGQKASFGIEGFEARSFDGSVERINPSAAAGARSIAVYIRIANPDQQLRGGMFAQGAIVVASNAKAVVVPLAAVYENNGSAHVLRIDDGTLVDTNVSLGSTDGATGLVEVLAGLQPGDRVVISGARNVKAGQAVRVLAPSAGAKAVSAHALG